jgi:transcription initiation factor TFIIIB Brf1 subunit/transcription initiation factor TFIIB
MSIIWQVAICPKCGSKDRFSEEENEYGETYLMCNKCGWYGKMSDVDHIVGRLRRRSNGKK